MPRRIGRIVEATLRGPPELCTESNGTSNEQSRSRFGESRADGSFDGVPVVHDHPVGESEDAVPADRQHRVPPAVVLVSIWRVVELTSVPLDHDPSGQDEVDPSYPIDEYLMDSADARTLEADPADGLEEAVAAALSPGEGVEEPAGGVPAANPRDELHRVGRR